MPTELLSLLKRIFPGALLVAGAAQGIVLHRAHHDGTITTQRRWNWTTQAIFSLRARVRAVKRVHVRVYTPKNEGREPGGAGKSLIPGASEDVGRRGAPLHPQAPRGKPCDSQNLCV